MTSAIDAAEEALALRDHLKDGEHHLIGNIKGKPVEHWAYKVQIFGAIVALVSAVAFAILNMIPAAIVGGILLATNIFGAYYLHKFRFSQQLEDYTKDLADLVHLYDDENKELKELNDSLEHIDKDMEGIPKHWEEEIEKGKKELQRVQRKFKILKKSYDEVLVKLSKFSTISKSIQQEAGSLAKETVKFGEENKLLEGNIKKISEGLDTFSKYNTDIQERNKELDQANQEMDRLEKEFTNSLEMIKQLSDAVKTVYEKLKILMSDFDKKVGEIKGALPDIKHRQQEIAQLNGQVEALRERVESLLENQKELKELRAFKKAKQADFDAWKKTSGGILNQ